MIPKKYIGEVIIGSYAVVLGGIIYFSGKYTKYDEETVKDILKTWF